MYNSNCLQIYDHLHEAQRFNGKKTGWLQIIKKIYFCPMCKYGLKNKTLALINVHVLVSK